MQLLQCAERASARSSSRCSRALNRELVRGSSVQSMRTMLRRCPQPSSSIHCICQKPFHCWQPLTKALKAATQLECKKKLRLVPEPTPHRPHADFADCQALRARAFAGALFGLPHWRHFYKGAGRAWDRCVGLVRGRVPWYTQALSATACCNAHVGPQW